MSRQIRVDIASITSFLPKLQIALPENKFVEISIIEGGYPMVTPGDEPKPSQPHITVADTLTSTADE
jgi:hypothetical protein